MKIQHPTFDSVKYDVPESTIDGWLSQGWALIDSPDADTDERDKDEDPETT